MILSRVCGVKIEPGDLVEIDHKNYRGVRAVVVKDNHFTLRILYQRGGKAYTERVEKKLCTLVLPTETIPLAQRHLYRVIGYHQNKPVTTDIVTPMPLEVGRHIQVVFDELADSCEAVQTLTICHVDQENGVVLVKPSGYVNPSQILNCHRFKIKVSPYWR